MLTPSKSLIGFTLDQNYFLNLDQINTALRREIKNTPHKSRQTESC